MSERAERIHFGTIKEGIEPPNLIEVQLNSYVDFLQKDVPLAKRKNYGLQAVFKEVFPIQSYDEKATLDFKGRLSARRCTSPSSSRKRRGQRKRKSTWARSRS